MTLKLAGKHFGRLTAIQPTDGRIRRRVAWEFLCDCGKTVILAGDAAASGHVKSCGCAMYEDLRGRRFGRLVANESLDIRRNGKMVWSCACDCGKQVVVIAASLKSGDTRSCGCLQRDTVYSGCAMAGPLSPRWNSDLTDEDRKKGRLYPEYEEWRRAVYGRDDYTCQKCGEKASGNLNAHHIEGYTANPELRTTLSNGITLCGECHNDFHHQYGRGDNTKQQLEEFLGR